MLEAIDLATRGALIETPQDESLRLHRAAEKEGCDDRLDGDAEQIRADNPRIRSLAGRPHPSRADEVLIWRAAVEDTSSTGDAPARS